MGFVIHWNESAMDLHVFPIPIPPPTSHSTRSLWVFPVHQVRVLVSCIQPGLAICFTLDNIHVSMLFFFLINKFIWLCQALVVVCKIFSCTMWDLVAWPGMDQGSLHWECGVLVTGTQGSPYLTSYWSSLLMDDPQNGGLGANEQEMQNCNDSF